MAVNKRPVRRRVTSAAQSVSVTKAKAPPKRKYTPRLAFARHGGHCCGMSHLFSFTGTTEANWRYASSAYGATPAERTENYKLDLLQDLETMVVRKTGRNKGCVEVVLTDNQVEQDDFHHHRVLSAAGFIRVLRFLNSNSGNYCNVYLQPYGQPFRPSADPLDRFVKG